MIYICSSETQSRVVEQTVLSACLVSEFTQIIFGQSPSNKIRGIAKNKAVGVIDKLKERKELDATLSLLGCRTENELLYSMNQ